MNNRPLQSLEELLIESFDLKALRERSGLPHPLSKFASNGAIKDGPCADAVLQFIKDLTLSEPESAGATTQHGFYSKVRERFSLRAWRRELMRRN